MDHRDVFPNWRVDTRNVASLYLNSACSYRGDTYSGAWSYPESFVCCEDSFDYTPMVMAPVYARYAAVTGSEWAREMARRQIILATYHCTENGLVRDGIDGGQVVAVPGSRSSIPCRSSTFWKPLPGCLSLWEPTARTTSCVVRAWSTPCCTATARICYTTFDADPGDVDVLRLAFVPRSIMADSKTLAPRNDLDTNGFTVKRLPNGDCIVSIRHDAATEIVVTGDDPATEVNADNAALRYTGRWQVVAGDSGGDTSSRASNETGASMAFSFTGNQARLLGTVGPKGGLADVYLDGTKQLVGIDCWNPKRLKRHVLYYKNGLAPGEHELKIVVKGTGSADLPGAR